MRQRKLYGQRRASVTYARENFVANLAFAENSITPLPIACCESFLQTLRKKSVRSTRIVVSQRERSEGRRQSNRIHRRTGRHARSQATPYAASARHSANAIERLCL